MATATAVAAGLQYAKENPDVVKEGVKTVGTVGAVALVIWAIIILTIIIGIIALISSFRSRHNDSLV